MEDTAVTKKMLQNQKEEKKVVEEPVETKEEQKTEVKKPSTDEKKTKPKETKKEEKKAPIKEEEKKREIVLERICTINLSKALAKPVSRRFRAAVRIIKLYLIRHFKTTAIKIDSKVTNSLLKSKGVHRKVTLKVTKDKEGTALAELKV
ncbi:MAG: hypothetical protein ABH803_03225 [Candidatus Micrarchaeota archaeon]